jgi:phage I-like protein
MERATASRRNFPASLSRVTGLTRSPIVVNLRAQVDAVLRVAALSELFTQDLEEASQRVAAQAENREGRSKEQQT